MDKWEYIQLITKRGDRYGYNGGVYDLLEWCGKQNTSLVTQEEAKEFWEGWPQITPTSGHGSRNGSEAEPD